MATGAFTAFNTFKRYLADGTIDLNSTSFDVHYAGSANALSAAFGSILSALTDECASGNGYTKAGDALAAVTWSTGTGATTMRFDGSIPILTASGGTIADIKWLVIVARTGASAKDPANKLAMFCQLTTAQFTLASGSTATTTVPADGVFELT